MTAESRGRRRSSAARSCWHRLSMANEGDKAVAFCQAVLEQCPGIRKVTFFAVFDRVTKDESLDNMRALERREPRLRVVWAPEDRCVVDAYLRGYKEALDAGCDWILEIDAGFSHQPSDIPQFFCAMEQGMDCVFGSRFIGRFEKSSLKRRFVSWGGTALANLLLGTRQTDMTADSSYFHVRRWRWSLAVGFSPGRISFRPRSRLIAEN